ncbi:MAG: hypothetical protein ISS17_02495 [Bacteroidales bacterium]|nr:hypothetical protein [Bacteroidales bacterium]
MNGGTNPTFQWKVNGTDTGTNTPVFTYIPENGDRVYCVLTSSYSTCTTNNPATSDTIVMIVNPNLPVSVTVVASQNPVCAGTSVTFTATPVNGGTSPTYQWKVNGNNTGTNSPAYSYSPQLNDSVWCVITSNLSCVSGNPATSNKLVMVVSPIPEVTLSACFDTVTTVNAKPFRLKGGIPLGGSYSGPGVDPITGYFNPAMAGLGAKSITYSYTNLYNCSNNSIRSITVVNAPSFTCGDSMTDIRDNQVYPTVQIGSQCWMAANLSYGLEIPDTIPQRDNCIPEKYSRPSSFVPRPSFYQWDELMRYEDTEGIQGLCPPGWHVPSEPDWNQLFAVYQGNAFAGRPLLYSGFSGFNAVLSGVEHFNRSWNFIDFATMFWSSTAHGPWKAWSHGLNDYNYSVSYYPSYRANAFSVRCVRD